MATAPRGGRRRDERGDEGPATVPMAGWPVVYEITIPPSDREVTLRVVVRGADVTVTATRPLPPGSGGRGGP